MARRDQHVSEPAREHPHQRLTATATSSSCFPGTVVERRPDVASAPTPMPSPPPAGTQCSPPSQFTVGCATRRVVVSSTTAAVCPSDATRADGGEERCTAYGPLAAAAGNSESAALSGGDGFGDSLSRGHLLQTSSPLPTGGSCRGAAMGRSMCSSSRESQPLIQKPVSPAAHHRWAALTADLPSPAHDDYHCVRAAAARPAARVVRVDRLVVRRQQREREEGPSKGDRRRVPAILERQDDSELQQIARQEVLAAASDEPMGFTVGDIVERPTEQLAQRRHEVHTAREQQQDGSQQTLQQMPVDACILNGPLRRTGQAGSAKQSGEAAGAAAVTTAAASACLRESGLGSHATSSHCVFVETQAPLGFPQPVHRSVLRQQLQQPSKQEEQGLQGPSHAYGGEPLQLGQGSCEEKLQHQRDTSAIRDGVSFKERQAVESTETTAEAGSGLDHARSVSSWRRSADRERASIEAEAAEMLRAMHPREIAATRQELLDRFGPRRFAVLQRRALRRAAAQQHTAPTEQPAGVFAAADFAYTGDGTCNQKSVSVPAAAPPPVGEAQQLCCPPSTFTLPSYGASRCTHSASDTGSSATLLRPPGDSTAAPPSAYVCFASGRGRHTASRGSAPSSGGAVADAVDDDAGGNAATAVRGSTAFSPGTASAVRLDVHEIAKLRWTDPLGPEDWQSGPFGFAEGVARGDTRVAGHELALKQFRQPSEALSSAVAAEKVARQLGNARCPTVFANIHVRIEQIRFDFDGCLRSDLLHLQYAVSAAAAGVRAAERRCSRQRSPLGTRTAQGHPPQGGVRQLSTPQSPHTHMQQIKNEKGNAESRTGKAPRRTQGEGMTASVSSESRRRHGRVASVKERGSAEILRKPEESTPDTDTGKVDIDGGAAADSNTMKDESENSSEVWSDESDPLEFYRGLHHHGDAAALPGYTLCELLHLAQSSNHAQAALALQTLAAVIRSGRTLFNCPSTAEAAAFAASVRRWADQQQYTGQPKCHRSPSELRQCERHIHEPDLQREKERPRYEEGQLLSRQHEREQTASQQCVGISEQHRPGAVRVPGEQDDDKADSRTSTLNTDLFSFPKLQFEVRAGYGLGLRRWYSYIARDLYLAWRLHALLHAQAAALHRASLCCLAAFFGPPASSGVRRRRAACWFESNKACSRHISDTCKTDRDRSRGNSCADDNVGPHSISSNDTSSAYARVADATTRYDSEAAVDRGDREAVVCEQGPWHRVSGDEGVDAESRGVPPFTPSENNLMLASQPQRANWGPGLTSLPLHLRTLPRQLRAVLLKDQLREEQQQQERCSSERKPPQECAVQQRVTAQQTWHGERRPQPHRQQRQGAQEQPAEEYYYVCVWGLGGWDFATEGLLVNDCCSGLHSIDSNENTCLWPAAAVGEDSGAGCRGVLAFWHAFFGRVTAEAAEATADPQQHQVRGQLSPDGSHERSVDQKAVGEKLRGDVTTVTASPATEKKTLKLELASAGSSEDSGGSSTRTTAASESKCCTVQAAKAGATAGAAMLRKGTAKDAWEITGAAGESDAGQSPTTLLYDSVGALFSSSPVEALLEEGNLLQRLALLLSIHRTDEDFERHALQLLLGLSAAGPASTACILSHARLQEGIRVLAEGLLIGSLARAERLQQQKLQQSLAVATSRAAENSRPSAAGVYFVAKAELHRHAGENKCSQQGTQVYAKGTSDKTTSTWAISSRHHDTTYCCEASSNSARQEDIKLQEKDGDVRGFLLRRTEYLLLRELLVLLRLWAGWAPSKPQDNTVRMSIEATAATAWNDTFIGQDSACCALLLQAFTDGIFLVEAAATREEAVACNFSTSSKSGEEAGAETAGRPTKSEKAPTHLVATSKEDSRESSEAVPADEDVLIAAVEAARVLRVLETRGALPHTFASFYPSAVQLLHSFTRRLGTLQDELLSTSRLSNGARHDGPPSLMQQQSCCQQHEESPQHGGDYDLGTELQEQMQEQMQELQQQMMETEYQGGGNETAELLDFLLNQGGPLDVTGQHSSAQAVATTEDSSTPGSSVGGGGNNSIIVSRRSHVYRSDRDIQRDVRFAWVFHGALVKELLRWGAVAAAEAASSEESSIDAHGFLLQVAPLLRVFPSLLSCWKQLESGCGLLDSFTKAAATQVLHAATQLLLVASRKVARALCSSDCSTSPAVADYTTPPDPLASNSESAAENDFTSGNLIGSGHNGDKETSSEESSSAGPSSSDSSTSVTTERLAVQQAAVCCWINLMEPLAETLVGRETDLRTALRRNAGGSADPAAPPQVEKNILPQSGASAGGGAEGGCLLERADEETRGASSHNRCDGVVFEEGGGETRGGLLQRLMRKMKHICSRNGGSSIAKALRLYAEETGWTSLTSCCCSQCQPCLSREEDMRNSCGVTCPPSENVCHPVRGRRWRGLLPATSESFAGTDIVDCFAALSSLVEDRCSRPARGPGSGGMASTLSPDDPQDTELFLSEASFLSAACSWVASSLHVLHHSRSSRYTSGSADATRERASAGNHVGCCRTFSTQQQKQQKRSAHDREQCTPQISTRRENSPYHRGGRTTGVDHERVAAPVAGRESRSQCRVFFSPEVLVNLADEAIELACALRGTLQCLFQELRWPQQSQSLYTAGMKPAAGVSATELRTWPQEGVSQHRQQEHAQHNVRQPQHSWAQSSRQGEPVSSGQHHARATSRPLILFEPLAQLMLSLQLLLRACERFSTRERNSAEEQRSLLAACSAAATPRTFLRALLMLYHSVSAPLTGEIQKHGLALSHQQNNVPPDEQQENEPYRGLHAFWLRGAAQWFSMCCGFPAPAQHHTANLGAASATIPTLDATHVYNLLMQAVAKSGAPLEQRQRPNAPEGTPARTWPWVLCAVDLLDVIANNAAKPQQDSLTSERAETGHVYKGAAQGPPGTVFNEWLAVCPIDGIVGGAMWQCFCCESSLASGHPCSMLHSAALSNDLYEALSLCRLVVWTPDLAQELQCYVPPSAVFAALVALYTEPHLTGTTTSRHNGDPQRLSGAGAAGGHTRRSPFNIYARPTVYDMFCRLLDKLLLQPVGKQLRDHAVRQHSEKWQAKQEAGLQVQAVEGVDSERQVRWEKGEDEQTKGNEEHNVKEEKHKQETQQQLDRLRDAGRLLRSTSLSCEYFYFSRSFLAVFCRACQTECSAVLGEGQQSIACTRDLPSNAQRPQECFRWFPVCCNKAQDVLIERAARLLFISQSTAEAADPLLSLLLWLLSSPAFPFECRRMLVRGEQTWLKVASQLLCFVCDVDMLASLRVAQPVKCPGEVQKQLPQQHVAQLAHQLEGGPREDVERWQQQGEPYHHEQAKACPSQLAQAASGTSEISASETSLQRASCWGMQSPRGDVFWFKAPDSLYAVLPGLWREDNEEILVGWSLYVQHRLAKGFLLPQWHPPCARKLEATGVTPQGTQAPPPATSCFIALVPLHALALLVADEVSSMMVPSLPCCETENAYEGTHQPGPQERQRALRQQQESLEPVPCHVRDGHQQEYNLERNNTAVISGAKLNSAASTDDIHKLTLPSPEPRRDPCRSAGGNRQPTYAADQDDIGTRFSKLKRLLKAQGTLKSSNGSEALASEMVDDIARIICGSRVLALHVERSP